MRSPLAQLALRIYPRYQLFEIRFGDFYNIDHSLRVKCLSSAVNVESLRLAAMPQMIWL